MQKNPQKKKHKQQQNKIVKNLIKNIKNKHFKILIIKFQIKLKTKLYYNIYNTYEIEWEVNCLTLLNCDQVMVMLR